LPQVTEGVAFDANDKRKAHRSPDSDKIKTTSK
jgi:hypothetical protein